METRLPKGESWSESEGLSSSDVRQHNVESLALHVIGLNWSGEKVSLFLEDWELARVATWPWVFCARKCMSPWLLVCRCQRGPLSQERKLFSHLGRAVATEERSVVRENVATS